MEEGGDDRLVVEFQVRDHVRDGDRVGDVRVACLAELAFVADGGVLVCLADGVQAFRGEVVRSTADHRAEVGVLGYGLLGAYRQTANLFAPDEWNPILPCIPFAGRNSFMTTRFQAPRGTQDVLPDMQPYWQAVNDAIRVVTRLHGFRRIDTPAFEYAGVFEKGSGDTTDIVEKEMYTFEDRGGEKLALTPEGTPAICRAYLEHGMASWPQPVRLYTTHQMFRYDRPQKGRYRQHTQFDCEIFGSTDPLVDAEVIAVLWRLYTMLGIRNAGVRLGSLDDIAPRRAYVERLKDYYRPHLPKLSEDSQRRFERNPLRLLDSKDERDLPFKEAAPKLVDNLSPEARAHHETVLGALEATEIPVGDRPAARPRTRLLQPDGIRNRPDRRRASAGDDRRWRSV